LPIVCHILLLCCYADLESENAFTLEYQGGLVIEFDDASAPKKVRGTNKFFTKDCAQIISDEITELELSSSIDILKEVRNAFFDNYSLNID